MVFKEDWGNISFLLREKAFPKTSFINICFVNVSSGYSEGKRFEEYLITF